MDERYGDPACCWDLFDWGWINVCRREDYKSQGQFRRALVIRIDQAEVLQEAHLAVEE